MAASVATTASPRRRRIVFLIACVGGVLLTGAAAFWWWSHQQTSNPTPPSVDLKHADPEFRQAYTASRTQLLATPKSPLAWGHFGMLLFANGYLVEADPCFAQAELLDSKDPRWPYYRGLLVWHEDLPTALKHLRRASTLEPSFNEHGTAIRLRLAEALLEAQQWDEAEAIYQRVLDHSPKEPRASYGTGIILLERHEPQRSLAYFQVAADDPVARRRGTIQLAVANRQLGNTDVAARLERNARALPEERYWPDPFVQEFKMLETGAALRQARIAILKEQGLLSEAVQLAIELTQAHPSAEADLTAGTLLRESGDFPRAEEYLRACLQRDADHVKANHHLAQVLFAQAEANRSHADKKDLARAQYQETITCARRCLDKKPDDGLMHLVLGRTLLRMGHPREAVEPLRLAVACMPDSLDAHLSLAEAQLASGAPQEAATTVKAAQSLADSNNPALKDLLERITRALAPPP